MKKEDNENKKSKITKKHIIIFAIILLLIIIAGIILLTHKKEEDSYIGSAEQITNVYPEDVDTLYAVMTNVSCTGDLYFDVKLDAEKNLTNTLNKKELLDYVFSYLDKNKLLTDEITAKTITDSADNLIYAVPELVSSIENYQYGDYVYNYKRGKVTRKYSKCTATKKYVTQLYGYSYNDLELSMDVSVGYLTNGILYTLEDKQLGAYDGDKTKLDSLFTINSFYRYNFVKSDKMYKLSSVELISKK